MVTGDELETLDRLRTRASEARDIITYYYDFAKGDLTRYLCGMLHNGIEACNVANVDFL